MLVGAVFLFLAIGGQFQGGIDSQKRKWAGALGALFMISGIVLYIKLISQPIPVVTPYTPTPISPTNTSTIEPTLALKVGQKTQIFSLAEANTTSFHKTGDVTFNLKKDNLLEITAHWLSMLWISDKLPKNFQALVHFKTEDPISQFVIGVGNASASGKRYHFTMTPNYTGFSRMRDTGGEDWFTRLALSEDPSHIIKPNTTFSVVFERINGVIKIVLDDNTIFVIDDGQEMNEYNYLFLTSSGALDTNEVGTIFVEELIIQKID